MKYSELLRKLKRAGWVEIRQKGSHKTLKRQGEVIVLPYHGSAEVKKGLASSIRKKAGLK